MFDGRWRSAVDEKTEPVGAWLQGHGLTADVLTATGLISATATAFAVGSGHLLLAMFLLALTGMHDLFDGPVAKAAGSSSIRGAFFDSVTDRITDALLMGGVAWYLVSEQKGHLVLLPLAILGVTALVSYQRAKAESLGLIAKGGLMERAERMILLGAGFLFPMLLIPVLWALLVLTSMTAIGRFIKVWQAANQTLPNRKKRTRALHLEARLHEWRLRSSTEFKESRAVESVTRWRVRLQDDVQSRSKRIRPRRSQSDRHSTPPR